MPFVRLFVYFAALYACDLVKMCIHISSSNTVIDYSFGRLLSCRTVAFVSQPNRKRVYSIGSSFESVVIECDCVLQIVDFAARTFLCRGK